MTDDDWSYRISKKYWQNKEELKIKLPENIKDVKSAAYLLKTFLEKEKLPFKIFGEIELEYSDKSADASLNEHWGKAFIVIPVIKRSFLKNPRYDKLEAKHYLKVRLTLDDSTIESWQEHHWDAGSVHRWYMEMEQIRAWKELLEEFSKSLPSLRGNSDIGNPSSR